MSYQDDLAAYGQALAENNLKYNLPDLYGFYAPGGPVAGQQTLAGSKLSGMFMNNPDLEAELAGGTFGPNMGYLAGKNTLDYGRLMGMLNGNPTLAANQLYGNSNGAAGGGTPTLDATKLNYDTAIQAADTLARLQGNPFKMEAVARGMDQTGIPNALKGLMQGGFVPGFQANQATPQTPGLASSLGVQGGAAAAAPANPAASAAAAPATGPTPDQISARSAWWDQAIGNDPSRYFGENNVAGATPGFMAAAKDQFLKSGRWTPLLPGQGVPGVQPTGMGGGPDSADPSSPNFDPAAAAGMNVDATTAAAPSPNKLNAVNYQNGPKTMQDFIKSLYESMGYNPNTIDEMTKAELPGFTAPRYGVVSA